jgi:hypothetical protein
MKRRLKWRIVIGLLIGSFVMAFWLLIDRHAIRTYQAHVTLDRYGEPSLNDPPWEGPDLVVLYRTGRYGVVCYDVLRAKELHDHLPGENGQIVTVEYETFSDFGKVRGYRLHSVDGMVQANETWPGQRDLFPQTCGRKHFWRESDCW